MRGSTALALLSLGCASAPLPSKPAIGHDRVALSPAPARCEPERAAPPARAPAANRCLPQGLPKTRPPPETADSSTCFDQRQHERALIPVLQKRYERVASGALDVSFGCDPAVGAVQEVVIETGYGHGGSLQIWRLKREDESSDFEVTAVAHDSWLVKTSDSDAKSVLVARGILPAKDLARALSTSRPALVASVREHEPPPRPNTIGLHRMFFSSGDFHHYLRLRDAAGHELAGGYTGYPNSGEQRQYVGVVYALDQLEPLLDRFELEREAPTGALRAWYSAHVSAAWPRLADKNAWWVRERMVKLAGKLGDPSLVPMIVSELERGLSELAAKPERAGELAERYLTDPLTVLGAVTGWDARRAPDGSVQPLIAAAREAVGECKRAF